MVAQAAAIAVAPVNPAKQHDKFLIGSANFLHYWSDRKMVIGLLITFHLSKLFTIYKVISTCTMVRSSSSII